MNMKQSYHLQHHQHRQFNSDLFHSGTAVILDKHHVDTDQIIPKQFLTSVSREGFGDALFHGWRYLPDGSVNPDFVLNQEQFRQASILVSRVNFGCGSSREHAPWALQQYGFKVIIAQSFADIFYNNCINNGLLPIVLDESVIDAMLLLDNRNKDAINVKVELSNNIIEIQGLGRFGFDINSNVQQRLLAGLDFIGVAESKMAEIIDYELQNG